jgi:hypothetical protein
MSNGGMPPGLLEQYMAKSFNPSQNGSSGQTVFKKAPNMPAMKATGVPRAFRVRKKKML